MVLKISPLDFQIEMSKKSCRQDILFRCTQWIQVSLKTVKYLDSLNMCCPTSTWIHQFRREAFQAFLAASSTHPWFGRLFKEAPTEFVRCTARFGECVRIGATPTHMEDVGDPSCAAPRGSNYSWWGSPPRRTQQSGSLFRLVLRWGERYPPPFSY